MTYLVAAIMIGVALVMLILGFVLGPALFMLAALLSAVTIFVIWKAVRAEQSRTFVTDPPQYVQPDWDRPLRGSPIVQDEDELDLRDDLGIPGYSQLTAAEVLPALETLSVEQLRAVIKRELAGLNRRAVITRAQVLIDLTLNPVLQGPIRGQVTDHRKDVDRDNGAKARRSTSSDFGI